MTRNAAYLLKSGVACAAFLFLLSVASSPAALADDGAEAGGERPNLTAYELQQEIEQRQAEYAAARDEADRALTAIDENQSRIAELEREIPAQQERSAQAAREMYKFKQQGAGVVDLLLNAGDFYEFLSKFEYVNRIADANMAEIERLAQLKDEVAATQAQLKEVQREAEARAEDARAAMEAAQEAQAEAQRRIEEEARAQAEIAAMAEALAQEERDNATGAPVAVSDGSVVDPGGPTDSEAPDEAAGSSEPVQPDEASEADSEGASSGAGGGVGEDAGEGATEPVQEEPAQEEPAQEEPAQSEPLSDEDAYVEKWAERIDAYLAGSPLAGQGETFARAAYQYGVDPRLSPAISFTESSKGLYCFKNHNAWGWGSAEWDSWEEAIYDHVAGLARGYGGQLSVEGAKKYCPPNWKTWYKRTSEQMELI